MSINLKADITLAQIGGMMPKVDKGIHAEQIDTSSVFHSSNNVGVTATARSGLKPKVRG